MGSDIGRTVATSEPSWPSPTRSSGPNIVVVVLDDAGFADLGCYGSEIATPHMDGLAASGVRFNNFHTTPLCSPTRAALLTGRNHHTVGMRFLAKADTGFPNCRGRIAPEAGTIAEVLRGAGYGTLATGKWHLLPDRNSGAAGPHDDWPLGKGFDRFYGFLGGVADQWNPDLVEDNHPIDPPDTDGYHISADIVDRSISYLKDHLSLRSDDPFLLYMSFGATHAPLQVPKEYIERYQDTFQIGWDKTREARLERQIELGIVPPGTPLAPRNEGVKAWADLSGDEQELAARLQATYAGFLEHTDEQIGRLIAFLGSRGVLDETLIMVLSDNGGSMEGGDLGAIHVKTSYAMRPQSVQAQLDQIDLLGTPASSPHYAAGWAMASNTPFRRYKRFVDGGGVNAPLIVHWPQGLGCAGSVSGEFVHAVDIMPTLLEIAAVEAPATLKGVEQLPIAGESIAPMLRGDAETRSREPQYFEMFGQRAIWADGWKAIADHIRGASYESDQWHLYNLDTDFSEVDDRAETDRERLTMLIELWETEALRHGVFPLDDRGMNLLIHSGPNHTPTSIELAEGQSRIASDLIPNMMSYRIAGRLSVGPKTSGVVVARGGETGGFTLFVLDGSIFFEVNELGEAYRLSISCESTGMVDFEATTDRVGSGATMTLNVGSAKQSLEIDSYYGTSFMGLHVGRDSGSPVSPLYRDRMPFECPPESIEELRIEFFEPSIPPPMGELDQLPPQ